MAIMTVPAPVHTAHLTHAPSFRPRCRRSGLNLILVDLVVWKLSQLHALHTSPADQAQRGKHKTKWSAALAMLCATSSSHETKLDAFL
jgi:hypothetical protein